MKAIIPAAGSGTRLLPHTYTMPKPLVQVAGKPILGHILDDLERYGIENVGLILGSKGDRIIEYVRSNYKFKLDHVYQDKLNGLGYAIYLYLREYNSECEPVLIVLSDTIFEADLTGILKSRYSTIAVHEVNDPKRFGIVELENGFIKRLVEKPEIPTSNLAIIGVYLINNPKLLFNCLHQIIRNDIKTRGEYQLTDALQLMLEQGEKIGTFSVEDWHDCGTPETLLETNRYLLERSGRSYKIDGSIIIPPVSIAGSAIIESSIIGPYVSIAQGAKVSKSIIQDSIINEQAIISNALIKKSLIGDNAVFNGQFSMLNIGDSSQITFGQ